MDWKTIKLNKKVGLKAGKEYAIRVSDDRVIIRELDGYASGSPLLGKILYNSNKVKYHLRQVTLDQIVISVTVDGKEIPRKYPYIIK